MDSINVLLASANYPNSYYMWGPWNKEANIAIANNGKISAEIIAPIPYSLPFKFFPYHQLSKIPLIEKGPEGKIHRPRFLYLMPKKIFYGYEGSFYRRSVEKYSKNLQKPDLVHCHHVYPDGYGFISSCKKWDVPLIVDIHSTKLLEGIKEKSSISNQVLETLNFARKIFCISQEIKSYVVSIGIPEEKLEMVPLGVDISKFKPRDKVALKKEMGITSKYVILYVGHLVKLKGIDYLIKAISYLPDDIKTDVEAIIIGDGGERANLESLCKNLGLDDIIHLEGNISRDRIPYYYSIADIFVLPSLSEGRPVVIYEAMASGCAIIATDLKGIREQIGNNKSGILVKPSSARILSSKIKELLENDGLMVELAENALESVFTKKLTWDDYGKRVIELYNYLGV